MTRERMNIYAQNGTKVVFDGQGGYSSVVDRLVKDGRLTLGQTYTVDHTKVGNFSSDVYLVEVPGCFNTSMFGVADDTPDICYLCGSTIIDEHCACGEIDWGTPDFA